MSCDYSGLFKVLRTKEDIGCLRRDMMTIEEEVYKTDRRNIVEIISENMSKDVAEIFYSQNISYDNITEHMREINSLVGQMREINIVLGLTPTGAIVDNVLSWLRKNTDAGIILNIEVDKSLLGGAIVSWQGKFGDYSLKTKWAKIWKENESKFLDILKV